MIKKTDLNNYFSAKFDKKMKELREAREAYLREQVSTVLFNVIGDCNDLRSTAVRLEKELDKKFKGFTSNFDKYAFDTQISKFGLNLMKNLVRLTTDRVAYAMDATTEYYKKIDTIHPIVDAVIANIMNGYAKQYESNKDSLKQLQEEIETIIKTSSTGNKAYNTLKELKVDMSDFVQSTSNLPAVIKLSIDPCIINSGGCK